MDKENVENNELFIYVNNELPSIICDCMNKPVGHYINEINQEQKDKYSAISLIL